MSFALADELDRKVITVGSFMGLSDKIVDQGRADARRIAKAHEKLDPKEVWVSLSWQKKFPKRHAYGEAFNAALSVAGATWKVANKLNSATHHMSETDFVARPLVSSDSLFTFLHVTRQETIGESIEVTRAQITDPEKPVTLWDYLFFVAAEPDAFEKKLFVAVGDNVPMTHSEECHSPALELKGNRLEVSAIIKKARPNGTPFYYMAAKPLTV